MTADAAQSPSIQAFVRQQTIISIAVSMAFSAGFFVLIFGGVDPVAVFKPHNLVVDFLPQAAIASFMAAFIPALITRSALIGGRLPGVAPSVLSIALRALAYAALGLGLGALAFAALYHSGIQHMVWYVAFAMKVIFGGLLGAIITPPAVRAVLKQG